jgi:hypothetical protein
MMYDFITFKLFVCTCQLIYYQCDDISALNYEHELLVHISYTWTNKVNKKLKTSHMCSFDIKPSIYKISSYPSIERAVKTIKFLPHLNYKYVRSIPKL